MKEVIGKYQAFVGTDKTVAELDSNPFRKHTIRATMEATPGALAQAVRYSPVGSLEDTAINYPRFGSDGFI